MDALGLDDLRPNPEESTEGRQPRYGSPTKPEFRLARGMLTNWRVEERLHTLKPINGNGHLDPHGDQWYRRATEQGYADAQLYLGAMYDNGEGVPQDDAEAVRWFRLAAEQGYAGAQFYLAGMYCRGAGVRKDYAEAVRWLRLAAEQGHADAQFNLGVGYAKGDGVPQDDAEAVRWYRLAAEQGHADARTRPVAERVRAANSILDRGEPPYPM